MVSTVGMVKISSLHKSMITLLCVGTGHKKKVCGDLI